MDLVAAVEHIKKTFPTTFEKIMPLTQNDVSPDVLNKAHDAALTTMGHCKTCMVAEPREVNAFYYDIHDALEVILASFDTSKLPQPTQEEKCVADFAKALEALGAVNPQDYAIKFHKAVATKDLFLLHPILVQSGQANSVSKREFTKLTTIELHVKWEDIEEQLLTWAGHEANARKNLTAILEKENVTQPRLRWMRGAWQVSYWTNSKQKMLTVKTKTELEVHFAALPVSELPSVRTRFEAFLATLSPLEAGKAKKHLRGEMNFESHGIMSRKAFIEMAADDGWELKHLEDYATGKPSISLYKNASGYSVSKTSEAYFGHLTQKDTS